VSAAPTFTLPAALEGELVDPSWGVLALLHLAIIEDEGEAVPSLYTLLQRRGGPAWAGLATRQPDGWRAADDLQELAASIQRRHKLEAFDGSWASRRAALIRWAVAPEVAAERELRARLSLRGAWRMPCGHSVQELDAPGVCDGCTIAKARESGPT